MSTSFKLYCLLSFEQYPSISHLAWFQSSLCNLHFCFILEKIKLQMTLTSKPLKTYFLILLTNKTIYKMSAYPCSFILSNFGTIYIFFESWNFSMKNYICFWLYCKHFEIHILCILFFKYRRYFNRSASLSVCLSVREIFLK